MRAFIASAGTLATVGSYKYFSQKIQNLNHEKVKAKTENQVQYKWDFNWDFRHPQDDWTDEMKEKYTSVLFYSIEIFLDKNGRIRRNNFFKHFFLFCSKNWTGNFLRTGHGISRSNLVLTWKIYLEVKHF